MILTGPKISDEVACGRITIDPFDAILTNPNSYDFRLGSIIKTYKHNLLDAKLQNPTDTMEMTAEGLELEPGKLYLGHTIERIGSDHFVPIIRGKSSTGRIGLFVHITADLIDIGSCGQITLMMHAVQNVKIYPGMRIGQVTFWAVLGDINLYKGKYNHSVGPQESQVYKDFN